MSDKLIDIKCQVVINIWEENVQVSENTPISSAAHFASFRALKSVNAFLGSDLMIRDKDVFDLEYDADVDDTNQTFQETDIRSFSCSAVMKSDVLGQSLLLKLSHFEKMQTQHEKLVADHAELIAESNRMKEELQIFQQQRDELIKTKAGQSSKNET